MKRIVLAIYCIFFVLGPVLLFGQNAQEIDSLETKLSEKLADTTRVIILNKLCQLTVDIDPDKSMGYAKQQLQFAEALKSEKQKAFSYLNIGNCYFNSADYKNALEAYIKAQHINEAIGNKTGEANCLGSMGNLYLELKNYDESIKQFEKALKIFIGLGNKRNTAAVYLAIGSIYSAKPDNKKALEYYEMSLKTFQDIGDKESESICLNNIAQLYNVIGDKPKALDYVVKALVIDQESGNVYGAALTLNNIGDLYHEMGRDKKAIEYYNRSLEKSRGINANDRILSSYKGLTKAYKNLGDYKQATAAQELYIQLNDSVYNAESSRQMAEMQARFDSEKKEKAISLLTKDKLIQDLKYINTQSDLRKQRIISYSVLFGLCLMVLLAFFVYRGYRQKRKANDLLEVQNALIEEKNKEITDSIHYAERIQRAILPSESDFEDKLPNSFVLFKPKDIVSGDFYWAEKTGDKTYYATVDCTGHGVPGGFMSMLGASLLNEIIIEKKITEPGEVLDMLRIKIIMALKQTGASGESKDGMDMTFCMIDQKKNTLTYAAANNPLWIVRDGKLTEHKADKQPVGVSGTTIIHFTQHTIELQKGDLIYTFTDGYADQFGGEKGKKFKYKELEKMLLANFTKPMQEQKQILDDNIETWKGKLDQVDDILVIGVRV